MPEAFAKDAVALVDIGFKSTRSAAPSGELIVNRILAIGGDRSRPAWPRR